MPRIPRRKTHQSKIRLPQQCRQASLHLQNDSAQGMPRSGCSRLSLSPPRARRKTECISLSRDEVSDADPMHPHRHPQLRHFPKVPQRPQLSWFSLFRLCRLLLLILSPDVLLPDYFFNVCNKRFKFVPYFRHGFHKGDTA